MKYHSQAHGTVHADSLRKDFPWQTISASPRLTRAMLALGAGSKTAMELNKAIGTPNAHNYLRTLRKFGCVIDKTVETGTDRDGKACRYGRYSLLWPTQSEIATAMREVHE